MKAEPRRLRRRLGGLLRELRIRNEWTQEELVTHLRQAGFERCRRSLISQIEIGAASIRGEEIYYLREVFGETFERAFWSPYHNTKPSLGEEPSKAEIS